MIRELVAAIGGMLSALPFVFWWAGDADRIPGPVWFWNGYHRSSWRRAIAIGWLACGVPAIIVVLVWAQSDERKILLDEADDFRERARLHRADPTP
ncbi:MAG: hypothetical protein JJE46_00500, partial [Acidimicrobiia bacterium]|nr:hypothetical protein [Acidimicrobiia bacterium]